MTFHLIGLGLEKESISVEALRKIKECEKIYLENYTVNFPYTQEELERALGIKTNLLTRPEVEDESIIKEAQEKNVALLVYGDPLSATTHTQLILACIEKKIPYQIFHNASILTAITETGLQAYKFGKVASMPNWGEHTNKPTSFAKIIRENIMMEAHTLILTDIGLEINPALQQLKAACAAENVTLPGKIIILSNAGTKNQKIYYNTPENPSIKEIELPFCIVIPTDMHFIEEDYVNEVSIE